MESEIAVALSAQVPGIPVSPAEMRHANAADCQRPAYPQHQPIVRFAGGTKL